MARVSVLIPAYNPGALLQAALDSVLSQTHCDFEVIVVDDGSTDGSVERLRTEIRDPRIRWLRQDNRGKSAALNHALDAMTGNFYAIQDADDWSYPTRIKEQVAAMEADPSLAAVLCGHDLLLNGRRVAPQFVDKPPAVCRDEISRLKMPAHDPTGLFRRSLVSEFRYDDRLVFGEGFDYLLRVGERHPMRVLGRCLYSYRITTGSLTHSGWEKRVLGMQDAVRLACERRGLDPQATIRVNQLPQRPSHRHHDNNLAAAFIGSVRDLRGAGRRLRAVSTGLAALRLHPLDPHYGKALVYALAPRWMARRLLRVERAGSWPLAAASAG